MTEWNLSDPDEPRVYYDLSEWDFEQQAELASSLAEVDIPHAWDGTELMVPEAFEAATDEVFATVEERLNIMGRGVPESSEYGLDRVEIVEGDDSAQAGEVTEVVLIGDDTQLTEYDLADWETLERNLVTDSLDASGIAYRWENDVLLVPTTDEESVDAILDEIESGDVIPVINDGADEVPFESLNSFFLAGERLRKHPRDAEGLERLLEALKIADPNRPPRGVELRVWRRSCELAEQLADALTSEESADFDQVEPLAEALHDHLRPLI